MKTEKMILWWNGHVPIFGILPMEDVIWDKVECFMDVVRKMGTRPKLAEG